MDKGLLCAALQKTLDAGVQRVTPPPGDFSWTVANMISHPLGGEHYRRTIAPLIAALESQAEIAEIVGTLQNQGTSAGLASIEQLAGWMIGTAMSFGAEHSVDMVIDYIGKRTTPIIFVVALSGVFPNGSVRLSEAIELMPFELLPDGYNKRTLGAPTMSRSESPTAALVLHAEAYPAFLGLRNNAYGPQEIRPDPKVLYDILPVLVLLGPSSPAGIMQWSQAESHVPLCTSVSGSAGHFIEIQSLGVFNGGSITDGPEVRDLVRQYLSMSERHRSEISIGLKRLALSHRRTEAVDRAIELGLALECLLVPVRSEQVTKKFISRGADYLGGTTATRNRKILDEIYEIRSQAVHSGAFEPGAASKLGGPDQVIAEGQQIATQLLRKMIVEGGRPQWPD